MRDHSEDTGRWQKRRLAAFIVLGGLGVFGLSLVFPGVRDQMRTQVLGASVKTTPAPTITSGPSGPRSSSSATFRYSDTEKGVTFMCALDTAQLAPCSSSGMTYTGLPDASYTFTVAARGVSLSPS